MITNYSACNTYLESTFMTRGGGGGNEDLAMISHFCGKKRPFNEFGFDCKNKGKGSYQNYRVPQK